MRDVLFRGKAKMSIDELNEIGIKHENGWVIGNYIENGFRPFIVGDLADVGNDYIAHEWWVEVVPESVGQWTGLNDKNSKKIHEGDIVKITNHPFEGSIFIDGHYEIGYNKETMELCCGSWLLFRMTTWCEVVGNTYENPELLEVSE